MRQFIYIILAKIYKNSHSDIRGYTSVVMGFFSYILTSGAIALSILFSNFALSQKIDYIGSFLFPEFTDIQITLLAGSVRPSNLELIQLKLSYLLTSEIFQVLIIACFVFLGSLLFKVNFSKAFTFAVTLVFVEVFISIFLGQII